jgi:hypothetical protein
MPGGSVYKDKVHEHPQYKTQETENTEKHRKYMKNIYIKTLENTKNTENTIQGTINIDKEKRKFLILSGFEQRPLCHSARSQSLTRIPATVRILTKINPVHTLRHNFFNTISYYAAICAYISWRLSLSVLRIFAWISHHSHKRHMLAHAIHLDLINQQICRSVKFPVTSRAWGQNILPILSHPRTPLGRANSHSYTHYRVHKNTSLIPIPTQIIPVHITSSYFSNNFNIILPPTSMSILS